MAKVVGILSAPSDPKSPKKPPKELRWGGEKGPDVPSDELESDKFRYPRYRAGVDINIAADKKYREENLRIHADTVSTTLTQIRSGIREVDDSFQSRITQYTNLLDNRSTLVGQLLDNTSVMAKRGETIDVVLESICDWLQSRSANASKEDVALRAREKDQVADMTVLEGGMGSVSGVFDNFTIPTAMRRRLLNTVKSTTSSAISSEKQSVRDLADNLQMARNQLQEERAQRDLLLQKLRELEKDGEALKEKSSFFEGQVKQNLKRGAPFDAPPSQGSLEPAAKKNYVSSSGNNAKIASLEKQLEDSKSELTKKEAELSKTQAKYTALEEKVQKSTQLMVNLDDAIASRDKALKDALEVSQGLQSEIDSYDEKIVEFKKEAELKSTTITELNHIVEDRGQQISATRRYVVNLLKNIESLVDSCSKNMHTGHVRSLKASFDVLDRNKDGLVCLTDLVEPLTALSNPLVHKCEELFEQVVKEQPPLYLKLEDILGVSFPDAFNSSDTAGQKVFNFPMFYSFLVKHQPEQKELQAQRLKLRLCAIFNSINQTCDGEISVSEFSRALERAGIEPSAERLAAWDVLLKAFTGNNRIRRDEFSELFDFHFLEQLFSSQSSREMFGLKHFDPLPAHVPEQEIQANKGSKMSIPLLPVATGTSTVLEHLLGLKCNAEDKQLSHSAYKVKLVLDPELAELLKYLIELPAYVQAQTWQDAKQERESIDPNNLSDDVKAIVDQIAATKAKEIAEGMANEMAEVLANKLAEERAEKLATEKAQKLAQELATEMAKEQAEVLAQERAIELAKVQAEVMAKEQAQVLAQSLAEEMAKQILENMGHGTSMEKIQAASRSGSPSLSRAPSRQNGHNRHKSFGGSEIDERGDNRSQLSNYSGSRPVSARPTSASIQAADFLGDEFTDGSHLNSSSQMWEAPTPQWQLVQKLLLLQEGVSAARGVSRDACAETPSQDGKLESVAADARQQDLRKQNKQRQEIALFLLCHSQLRSVEAQLEPAGQGSSAEGEQGKNVQFLEQLSECQQSMKDIEVQDDQAAELKRQLLKQLDMAVGAEVEIKQDRLQHKSDSARFHHRHFQHPGALVKAENADQLSEPTEDSAGVIAIRLLRKFPSKIGELSDEPDGINLARNGRVVMKPSMLHNQSSLSLGRSASSPRHNSKRSGRPVMPISSTDSPDAQLRQLVQQVEFKEAEAASFQGLFQSEREKVVNLRKALAALTLRLESAGLSTNIGEEGKRHFGTWRDSEASFGREQAWQSSKTGNSLSSRINLAGVHVQPTIVDDLRVRSRAIGIGPSLEGQLAAFMQSVASPRSQSSESSMRKLTQHLPDFQSTPYMGPSATNFDQYRVAHPPLSKPRATASAALTARIRPQSSSLYRNAPRQHQGVLNTAPVSTRPFSARPVQGLKNK